jgi:hypothetical protein
MRFAAMPSQRERRPAVGRSGVRSNAALPGTGLADRPIVFLFARRRGEVSGELDSLLSCLRSDGLLTEREVGYIDADGVAALTRGLLADELPRTLVDLLVERTRGIPLFVRALVRTLIDSGRLFRSGERWVRPHHAPDLRERLVDLVLREFDDNRRISVTDDTLHCEEPLTIPATRPTPRHRLEASVSLPDPGSRCECQAEQMRPRNRRYRSPDDRGRRPR